MLFRSVALAAILAACGEDTALPAPDARPVDAFDPGPDELPCDVKAALDRACTTCHSDPASSNAPQPLTTRLDFYKDSVSVDGQRVAQVAASRLSGSSPLPMPPRSEPPAAAADLAAIRAWLDAGTPPGTCGRIAAKPVPTTCASGAMWTQGETGSEQMLPGKACRTCHAVEATEINYFFQGTAFPSLHESDLCEDPPPANARVEILDGATGNVTLTLTPDATGNFSSLVVSPGVPIPYRARVIANGQVREMTTGQTSGDCNACHTEQGTHASGTAPDAPGRITWPE